MHTEAKIPDAGQKRPAPGAGDGFGLLARYRSAAMGFAALWILFFHEGAVRFYSYEVFGKLYVLENFIKRTGFCGVDIFLFLSGIGLVHAMNRSPKLPAFYYRRLRRILVPYIVMGLLWGRWRGWTAMDLFKRFTCISFYTESIYAILWFIPMILTFYLIFPLYYKLLSRAASPTVFTGCVLTVWMLFTMYLRGSLRGDLFVFTNRIPIFVIGILMGWLSTHQKLVFGWQTWLWLGLICLLGAYLSFLCQYRGLELIVPASSYCIPDILMGSSLPVLLSGLLWLLAERCPVRLPGRLAERFLSFFGVISMEFYCVQELLGEWLQPRLDGLFLHPFHRNLVILAAVTAASLALYLLNKYFWAAVERAAKKLAAGSSRGR